MLWVPMIVMLAVTLTSLIQKMIQLIGNPTPGNILQFAFAIALFILGVIVALLGLKKLTGKDEEKALYRFRLSFLRRQFLNQLCR